MKYTKEKIAASCIVDITYKEGQVNDDFIRDQLTAKMQGFIYSHLSDVRTVSYTFSRPTFMEWLLRKPRTVNIECKMKEILINPPKNENVAILYFAEPENNPNK